MKRDEIVAAGGAYYDVGGSFVE